MLPNPLARPGLGVVLGVLATTVEPVTTAEPDRWDPPWLEILVVVAAVLVVLAFAWWLFLVLRFRDDRGKDG